MQKEKRKITKKRAKNITIGVRITGKLKKYTTHSKTIVKKKTRKIQIELN